ncbi:MAG: type IV pili twitching motility protein PilT [Bdellovibrionaceae bacterium]|nr:type IV pili twitching motility protein PilT [Pseudobdellovibrionaceae bacterium]|tara:strand:+ start:32988 stop:34055 length:1068 start_codon:yes stop_codon:yes gene_type:complete
MITLHQLLKAAVKQNASDLHIVAGSPPVLRVDGRIVRVKTENLTTDMTQRLCYSILTESQKGKFEATKELDFSFGVKGTARFRANLFFQRGAVSGVFRKIPVGIPDLESLQVPPVVRDLSKSPSGLVLITGPTGSGKSTTIAAMIDRINQDRRGHIVTLEDPIEYVHGHKNCIVNQREIGVDSVSYRSALKHILRQDPDIVLMGELRDLDTIESALNVAETGHLVFSTLHTNSAAQSINRIVNVFPAEQQERIRMQLSLTLNAVVSQRLIPGREGGMVAAFEVMIMNSTIRNLIRENKIHQLYGMMQVGQDKTGMVTMNQSLARLVIARKIDVKTAFLFSQDPDELDKILKQAGV